MRVALIQSEVRQDRNAFRVATLLRDRGHEVVLIVPQTELAPSTPAFAAEWLARGLAWIPVSAARLEPAYRHFPQDRGLAAGRRLSDLLTAFDTAWFFERHWAMPALRDRRFKDRLLPLVVLDAEPDAGTGSVPGSLEEINRRHSREYARTWADIVCSSSEAETEASVGSVERLWALRRESPPRPIPEPATSPAVTVCIPYFEAHTVVQQTLQSLERQTFQDFTVVVVDDGSRSEEGRRAFDDCAKRYGGRGWKFLRQTNQFPGAARNHAARESVSEFLLFLDSDDIAMPTMVERFLRAALLTGDECLVAVNYSFKEDPEGPCELLYDPPGNSLIGSMADDMHGGACVFVRREAFWSIGGFTEMRGVGFEDYEFHVRCNLKGLRWDVFPELVYRYRAPEPGNVSRSTQTYQNVARVRRWYQERLLGSGLEQLPLAFAALYWRNQSLGNYAHDLRNEINRRMPKRPPAEQKLRLLLLTSDFPYGAQSGWNRRVQEMIRYFGSRYELTLVTLREPEGYLAARKEALRQLHALREVEWTDRRLPGSDSLPARVRDCCRVTIQGALQAIPTSHYHAAIIDTIFMAEFRHCIDTTAILTEHNIESQLLRQAKDHTTHLKLSDAFRDAHSEAELLAGYENRTWPAFPLRAVCSAVDRAEMDRRVKSGYTVVAPNGADPSRWLENAKPGTDAVLFPAHLGYLPNVDAVEFLLTEVWPKVRKRKPSARLILAGRSPSDGVKSAAQAAAGVELVANPPSMDRLARKVSLTVVPLRLGSGTRLKILESMAWGLPVVSTNIGCEGIDAADGEHLLIRDDPDEFAEAMIQVMSDSLLWGKLRQAGRRLVQERYSWDRAFEPLEVALIDMIS